MISNLIKLREEQYGEVFHSTNTIEFVEQLYTEISRAHQSGKKILLCGNGGSCSQASHFAAELMVRYKHKNNNFFALSLNADNSVITAVSNDYSFEYLYEKQIENIGCEGDIFIALSTSGNSINIINGLKKAKEKGMITFAFLGEKGCNAAPYVDYPFYDLSNDTAIIQEHHLILIHLICECIEQEG